MSNILIIKHGSLGDLIQANGAIKDIKRHYNHSKVILLTSQAFSLFMSECDYIDGVITDKRLPRWNLFYLLNLKNLLARYNFTHVYDLQNSSRSKFYRKFLLNKSIWSSSETILEKDQKKIDFDKEPVLDRMEIQLKKSYIPTKYVNNIDLSWAIEDISRLIKQYSNGEFILIFPFCSLKHKNKRWPFYRELILKIKKEFKNKYPILIAPGPGEINEAKNLGVKIVLEDNKAINIKKLISLIYNAKYIVSNDTGPAHIASHLKKKGLVLFGSHTSAKKVSIENYNFKALNSKNLANLDVDTVMKEIKAYLN